MAVVRASHVHTLLAEPGTRRAGTALLRHRRTDAVIVGQARGYATADWYLILHRADLADYLDARDVDWHTVPDYVPTMLGSEELSTTEAVERHGADADFFLTEEGEIGDEAAAAVAAAITSALLTDAPVPAEVTA